MPLVQVMQRKGFSATLSPLTGGDWEAVFEPLAGDRERPEADLDWPEPRRFLDCTGHMQGQADALVREELAMLGPGEVLFALLPEDPLALKRDFDEAGMRWAGQWDAVTSGYAIMVQRRLA